MKVSIVIPTYNGKEKVVNCLRSLEKQSQTNFETIVLIDGSIDGTEPYLKSLKFDLKDLKIIYQQNSGRAGVRNAGARLTSSEFVMFLDDDMRLEPDVVERHIHFHTQHSNCILVGNALEDYSILTKDFHFFRASLSRKWTSQLGLKTTQIKYPFITAAHLSLPKTLFYRLGGFDNSLKDAEDYDLALRVFKEKIPVYFDPALIGWHDDLFTCVRYVQRQREYKKAHLILRKKYPELENKVAQTNKLTFLKRLVFGYPIWPRYIDAEPSFIKMLPKKIRYKLYDFVVSSQV